MSYENNPTLRVSYALGVNWQGPNCKQAEAALPVIYERMKEQLSEKYRDQIISLREITAHRKEARSDNQLDLAKELKAKADQIKKDLPMFTPSGTFPEKNRTKNNLLSYSGRIVADIDLEENRHLLPSRLEELKQQIGSDPCVEAVCISPSGYGLKAFFVVPPDSKKHSIAFEAVEKYLKTHFDVNIDKSGKDISRGCFITYDPKIIVKAAVPLDIESWKPDKNQKPLAPTKNSTEPFSTDKYKEMLAFISDQDRYDRWVQIGHALKAELGNAGYPLWADWSAKSEKWNEVDEAENRKTWESFTPDQIRVGTIIFLAKKGGWTESFFDTDKLDLRVITSSVPILERGILPDELEQYLSLTAQQFGVNYSAAVACFIGNAAFALGGNKWIKIEDDRIDRAILWNALIGKSGDGKTPLMMEAGGKYLNDLHNQWDIEYQNARGDEGDCTEELHLKRLLSNSLTLEMLTELHTKNPLGIGIYSDELLMCIEGMDQFSKSKSAVIAKILSLWTGIRLDNPTMKSDRRISNPYVCLMGGIQPALLDKLLNEQNQESGLAPRFLLSYVEENQEITTKEERDRLGREKQILGGTSVISNALQMLVDNREGAHTVCYDPKAGMLMGEFEDSLKRKRKRGSEAESAAYPKLVTYCHRLALLLHYLREPDPESVGISLSTVQSTIKLVQFYEQCMKRAYGKLELNDHELKCQKVYERVKALGEASGQKIRDGVKKSFKDSSEVTSTINELVESSVFIELQQQGKTVYRISSGGTF